ncbi:VacJ family lipoprotein [Marinomonas agarivorans]|nr:VacJ family lipoprotein [Marinomonas agarivorans]
MQKIKVMTIKFTFLACFSLISLVSVAGDTDPWERFNRSVHTFNSALDRSILKPIAQGYDGLVPEPIKKGTSNFFDNFGEVNNTFNNLLQGKFVDSAASGSRFLINTTVGIFGIFDVATAIGIEEQQEDFGQTLGYWGVGSGPYLVLPFLGPSTIRDGTGSISDFMVNDYVSNELLDLHWEEELVLDGLDIVQRRAKLLPVEGLIIGDEYSFIRDVYLQSRENDIHDGNPPESESDSAWGDDDAWGDEDDSWNENTDDGWGDDIDYGDEDDSDVGTTAIE